MSRVDWFAAGLLLFSVIGFVYLIRAMRKRTPYQPEVPEDKDPHVRSRHLTDHD